MSALSNDIEQALLNHMFRNIAFTSPTTAYVALYTSDPTDANTGAEVADSAYARQAAAFDAPVVSGAGYQVANSGTIQFPAIADAEVTVTHFAAFTAATGGTMMMHGTLDSSRILKVSDVVSFSAGSLTFSLE